MKKYLNIILVVLVILIIIFLVFNNKMLKQEKNDIKNEVTSINIEKSFELNNNTLNNYTLNQEDIYIILNVIDNLQFTAETCDGIPSYYIKFNSEEKESFLIYGLEIYENEYHITNSNKGEAILNQEQKGQIDNILNKY